MGHRGASWGIVGHRGGSDVQSWGKGKHVHLARQHYTDEAQKAETKYIFENSGDTTMQSFPTMCTVHPVPMQFQELP